MSHVFFTRLLLHHVISLLSFKLSQPEVEKKDLAFVLVWDSCSEQTFPVSLVLGKRGVATKSDFVSEIEIFSLLCLGVKVLFLLADQLLEFGR